MKKQLFLALLALTSLGSLQAADPSLTDTASFVLKSSILGITSNIQNVESVLTPQRLIALTATAFVGHYVWNYRKYRARCQYLERRIQEETQARAQELADIAAIDLSTTTGPRLAEAFTYSLDRINIRINYLTDMLAAAHLQRQLHG